MEMEKFEILEELGRGVFGTVYKAREKVQNRLVAIKILHSNLINDPNFLGRFKKEAEIAANLDHPNLVPIYDFGEAEGYYYIVMGYMPGGSLKELIKQEGPISQERTLEVLTQISDGLSYAHSHNVIHRDLKPSNILFDDEGKPRVSDMGFAELLFSESNSPVNMSDRLVGSPAYMAPEIWGGEKAKSSTDIYSLACIFVEMLTGTPLFDGENTPEVVFKQFQPLALPENFPLEWFAVIEKAVDKVPSNRFTSAQEFVSALRQETSEPCQDTEEPGMDGFVEIISREDITDEEPMQTASIEQPSTSKGAKKPLVRLLLGVGAGLIALIVLFVVFKDSFFSINQSAPNSTEINPTNNEFLAQQQPTTPADRSRAVINKNNLSEVVLLNTIGKGNITGLSLSSDQTMLALGTGYGIYILDPDDLTQIRHFGQDYSFDSLTFFPDNHRIAASNGWFLSIWDANTGRLIDEFYMDFSASGSIAVSDDGLQLSVGDYWDDVIYSIDPITGVKGKLLDEHYEWTGAVHQENEYLIENGSIKVQSKSTGKTKAINDGYYDYHHDVIFSHDDDVVLGLTSDGLIRAFDVSDGDVQKKIQLYANSFSQMDLEGNCLVSNHFSDFIRVLDLKELNIDSTYAVPREYISAGLSPDGHTYAIGTYEGETYLRDLNNQDFDLKLGDLRLTVTDPDETVYIPDIAFSPDGKMVAAGSFYENTSVWDVASGNLIYEFDHSIYNARLTFSPDSNYLAAAGFGLGVWDMRNSRKVISLDSYGDVNDVAFSPDGSLLAVGLMWGEVLIMDTNNGDILATLDSGRWEFIYGMDFSNDGSMIAIGTGDGLIRLWGVSSRAETRQPATNIKIDYSYDDISRGSEVITTSNANLIVELGRLGRAEINEVKISPDGNLIAAATLNGVYLYESETFQDRGWLAREINTTSLEFSSDNSIILEAHESLATAWDVGHGVELFHIDVNFPIEDIAISTYDQFIATVEANGHVTVFDMEGYYIDGFNSEVTSPEMIAFSPDNNLIAVGGREEIELWDWSSGKLIFRKSDELIQGSFDFSPEGDRIVLESHAGPQIVDIVDGTLLTTLSVGDSLYDIGSAVKYLAKNRILVGGDYGWITLWDPQVSEPLISYSTDHDYLVSMDASDDGKFVASWRDGRIELWDINTASLLNNHYQHSASVNSLSEIPSGDLLVSSGGWLPGLLGLWDLNDFVGNTFMFGVRMFSVDTYVADEDDSIHIAFGNYDGDVGLFDLTAMEIQWMEGHEEEVRTVAFSSDGTMIASGSDDATVKLWDVDSNELIDTFRGHSLSVRWVTFSPDGELVVSGSDDATIKIWDVATGRLIKTITDHEDRVRSVVFSPDGKYLASSSNDYSIKLWDTKTWKNIGNLSSHNSYVPSVSFSPNGKLLVSADADGYIKLWDLSDLKLITTLGPQPEWIPSVKFLSDGKTIATSSGDGTIRLWGIPNHE